MMTNDDQKPKDTTEAGSEAGVSCAAPAGYAANGRCAECGCKPPGHGILCKTGNDIARKSQAAFAARLREAKRKRKRHTAERRGPAAQDEG